MTWAHLVYALFAGIIPSLIWLFIWLREDAEHPEPRNIIFALFIFGGLSVVFAIIGEKLASTIFTNNTVVYFCWSFLEEIIKFSVAYSVAITSKNNDEPIDAMVYCITAALGFAAIENALFALNPIISGNITESLMSGGMRFLGATLVHVISSATIGFALGWAFYKSKAWKAISFVFGLMLAITAHAIFNISIINMGKIGAFQVFVWVWIAVIVLIVLFEEVKRVKYKDPLTEFSPI